jgi:hypothetical protein
VESVSCRDKITAMTTHAIGKCAFSDYGQCLQYELDIKSVFLLSSYFCNTCSYQKAVGPKRSMSSIWELFASSKTPLIRFMTVRSHEYLENMLRRSSKRDIKPTLLLSPSDYCTLSYFEPKNDYSFYYGLSTSFKPETTKDMILQSSKVLPTCTRSPVRRQYKDRLLPAFSFATTTTLLVI